MMHKLPVIVTFLFLNFHSVYSQIPVFEKKWDKRFGGTEDEIIGTFHITSDSGFVLAGSTFSGISGDISQPNFDSTLATSDFWIVRVDQDNIFMWEQRLGGTLSENLQDAILSSDQGIVAGGQSYSDAGGDKTEPNRDNTLQSQDYWIVKTDSTGNKQWDKTFGGDSYELFTGIKQLGDGGFIVSGSSYSGISGDKTEPSQGGWDYWLIRTDSSGNKIWDKRFGGTSDDFATGVAITSDGNIVVGGYSQSEAGGDKSQGNQGIWDYWAIKIDLSGTKIWDKTYGGNDTDWLFAITATADGGVILGGQSFSGLSGDKSEPNHDSLSSGSDRWILKIDVDGNKQWDRTIGGTSPDDLSRIIQTTDMGYLISGESYSDISGDKTESNLGPEQTWVVKIDSTGVLEWDKTIFTWGHDECGTALPYGDGCFVTVNFTIADTGGYKSEIGWGNGDYWMVKLCEENSLDVEEFGQAQPGILIYPNPFTGTITLKPNNFSSLISLEILDSSGKNVYEDTDFGDGVNSKNINLYALAPGVYVCRVIGSSGIQVTKLIKTE
jgi:hypothetical protein